MNLKEINIVALMRQLIFTLLLLAMLIQPLSKVIATIMDANHTEFASLDGDEESDEKENEHEENEFEDEIIKVSDTNTDKVRSLEDIKITAYKILQPNWDFDIEIPIPPPELLS